MKTSRLFVALLIGCCCTLALSQAPAGRWSEAKANEWYANQPWLVGSNYIPANAINELEMWQADTFDPNTIDKELGWAEGLGMTTMRVFLHDLPWQQDAKGYQARINQFLDIAAKHKIKPLLVLFDSCWDPNPHLGKQHDPKPGVHNSGWLQAPGAKALQDPKEYPRLKTYVTGVVGAFGKDARVLGWDVWNEPDNMNTNSYGSQEPKNKVDLVLKVLPQVFAWARSGRRATVDLGRVEGRLVERRQALADGARAARALGRHLVPQLRQGAGIREAHPVAAALPSSYSLHRVHGARQRQHVRRLTADREEVQGGRDQLGFRCREDADVSAVGLVAEALCRPSTAGVVPRDFQAGRNAVQGGRGGSDPEADGTLTPRDTERTATGDVKGESWSHDEKLFPPWRALPGSRRSGSRLPPLRRPVAGPICNCRRVRSW
jgi:hypothetical protein